MTALAVEFCEQRAYSRIAALAKEKPRGQEERGGAFDIIGFASARQTYGQKIHSSKYSTVALLTETKNVPLSAFTLELEHALQPIARTLRLTSDFIIRTFGDTALDRHLSCVKLLFSFQKELSYKKLLKTKRSVHCDFSRLARFLTGTSYGLVLGGGGARGIAHIGLIKAILEADIPIDMVGGVSMGAFIGGLWCQETDITSVIQKAEEWAKKTSSWQSYLYDITFPRTAMFTGCCFNENLKKIFNNTQIEDLWLPYFTVSTDITNSSMRVHEIGKYKKIVHEVAVEDEDEMEELYNAMFKSGDSSDEIDEETDDRDFVMTLGCYAAISRRQENKRLFARRFQGDIMYKRMEAQNILAIDVGSQNETDFTNYGDSLGIFKMLPLSWTSIKIPNVFEIQSRLAYICCQRQLEHLKNSNYCTYLRPPIDSYDTLDFEKFDEIFASKDIRHDIIIDLTQMILKVQLSKQPSDRK
ncbi:patatin-like phospholipase domain-containing protein 7 [Centruroides sculpturatus]|uniref:patatin-like phospholipase domain-containing protein 7 n=1 Tax=Centruroides sculpturatus TaxID=218467 RepID=UPI000C6CFBEC|nr:patatin-like phospholipase domain-containing protein 7 [Centruroides sculpturatus]